jgi:hypothetical protein
MHSGQSFDPIAAWSRRAAGVIRTRLECLCPRRVTGTALDGREDVGARELFAIVPPTVDDDGVPARKERAGQRLIRAGDAAPNRATGVQ